MKSPISAVRSILALWRAAWMTALQYRSNFVLEAIMAVFWLAWTVVPLRVVFDTRVGVAGWTYDQSLLVVGFFVTLKGLLDTFVEPNLRSVVEQVRMGTLDFTLLKPVDAQLMISTTKTMPAKLFHVVGGVGLLFYASGQLPQPPSIGSVIWAFLLLSSGLACIYSLWLAVVSLAFFFVRIDNLSYVLESVLDAGRWPVDLYRGGLRFVFTFVVPVGLMTTYPSLALLGNLSAGDGMLSIVVSFVFLFLSRQIWEFALARYSSASS